MRETLADAIWLVASERCLVSAESCTELTVETDVLADTDSKVDCDAAWLAAVLPLVEVDVAELFALAVDWEPFWEVSVLPEADTDAVLSCSLLDRLSEFPSLSDFAAEADADCAADCSADIEADCSVVFDAGCSVEVDAAESLEAEAVLLTVF